MSQTTSTLPVLGTGAPVLTFDVGGTHIKAALVDHAGSLVQIVRHPTPVTGAGTGEAVVSALGGLARDFRARWPELLPAAAGLVVPGEVDEAGGIGVFAGNLGWRDFPFRDRASVSLGVPVSFGHDVRSAGEAEYRLGVAAPFRDVLFLAIGTGIAGAVFVDGRLRVGSGLAGEMGHSRVADGPECACGGYGCLEAVASAAAIVRRYNALTGAGISGSRDLLHRVLAGDAAAEQIWDSALDSLALGLSHSVALLDPEAIVIGGGLSQAGPALFEPLAAKLSAILTFQHRPALLPATLGDDAGVIGAALRARDLTA